MKNLLLLVSVLLLCSCASSKIVHETLEDRELTTEEYSERISKSVTLIYEAMLKVSDAAQEYAADNNGILPSGGYKNTQAQLQEGRYVRKWPTIPAFAFKEPKELELRYSAEYDDMDGIGALDDTLYAQDLKLEICKEFSRLYASPGFSDTIHDYAASGEKYPGETVGRHIKIYAISWAESPGYCDIEWVIQYRD